MKVGDAQSRTVPISKRGGGRPAVEEKLDVRLHDALCELESLRLCGWLLQQTDSRHIGRKSLKPGFESSRIRRCTVLGRHHEDGRR